MNMNKQYFFNKEHLNHNNSKKTIKNPREKSELLNFTSALKTVETEQN